MVAAAQAGALASVTVVATAGMAAAGRSDQRAVNAQSPTPPRPIRTVSSQRRRAAGSTISIGHAGKAAIHHAPRHQSIRPHLPDHIAPSFSAISTSSRWICAGSATRIGPPKGEYLVEDFVRDLHELVEQLNLRDT